MEVACVFDKKGIVFHWHTPPGSSSVSIPDSRDLWSVMWEHRGNLGGVAHTHPWYGVPSPSGTDITTFSACELALGQRLIWPIVTFNHIIYLQWTGPDVGDYSDILNADIVLYNATIKALRVLSMNDGEEK
jgi:hypothetical protein